MNWTEKTLADHADAQFRIDERFRGRAEVGRSQLWYAEEEFADAMADLTRSILNIAETSAVPLDTHARIRDHGHTGGQRVRHPSGRNRGND